MRLLLFFFLSKIFANPLLNSKSIQTPKKQQHTYISSYQKQWWIMNLLSKLFYVIITTSRFHFSRPPVRPRFSVLPRVLVFLFIWLKNRTLTRITRAARECLLLCEFYVILVWASFNSQCIQLQFFHFRLFLHLVYHGYAHDKPSKKKMNTVRGWFNGGNDKSAEVATPASAGLPSFPPPPQQTISVQPHPEQGSPFIKPEISATSNSHSSSTGNSVAGQEIAKAAEHVNETKAIYDNCEARRMTAVMNGKDAQDYSCEREFFAFKKAFDVQLALESKMPPVTSGQ